MIVYWSRTSAYINYEYYVEFHIILIQYSSNIIFNVIRAVVLSYNLGAWDMSGLNLTMAHVVGIYNGSLRWWNDSSIVSLNPERSMPKRRIGPIVRVDHSGTTDIFTSALSEYSADWRSVYGRFSESFDDDENVIHWNASVVDLIGRTNRAVSGIILSYRYSIGYLSVAEATVAHLPYANILTENGTYLPLTTEGLTVAVRRSFTELAANWTADLVKYNPEGHYPMIGYTYMIANKVIESDCQRAREFVRFVEWCMTESFPRNEVIDYQMAPLPPEVVRIITEDVLKTCYCGGLNLYDLVQVQIKEEFQSTQTWRLPVIIIAPIVGAILLALLGYVIVQQIKLRNAIMSDDWRISEHLISLKWSRKWGVLPGNPGSAASLAATVVSNFSFSPVRHVTAIGVWKGRNVCLREILSEQLPLHRTEAKRCLITMRDKIQHVNVLRFYGITSIDNETFIISEHAPKGTLSDVVQNDKYRIDENITFSLAIDVAMGMTYLHGQNLLHGRLTPECCLVDHRWNIKISEWEYNKFQLLSSPRKASQIVPCLQQIVMGTDTNMIAKSKFWTAPELLTSSGSEEAPSRPVDVYSFAIILVEIFTREDPYAELTGLMEPVDIIDAVSSFDLRPNIAGIYPKALEALIRGAWSKDPETRPTFQYLTKALGTARPSRKSVMDGMMEALEGYISNLEEKVMERTVELASANEGLENLLHQILPKSVAEALANGQAVTPMEYDSVTVFFSDIVGFTALCASSSPMEVVTLLNDLYNVFDWVIDKHDVYKVETIGDSYMVISGVPKRNGIAHASNIAMMALDLMSATDGFTIRHKPGLKLQIRSGIHSGPVVAGVVGSKMPRYCLFGDTVNMASRLESTSEPMKIQVSACSKCLLVAIGGFTLQARGETEIKVNL